MNESVGIATGLLLAAAQQAGLATLTHTPSPMGFLTDCLGASEHERPFVLIPIGWPHPDATVPDQSRSHWMTSSPSAELPPELVERVRASLSADQFDGYSRRPALWTRAGHPGPRERCH